MWIFTRARNENDIRFLLNVSRSSRVNLTQLGERWFIEVMMGTESVPVASTNTREEAARLLQHIFDGLRSGVTALDLGAPLDDERNGKRPAENAMAVVGAKGGNQ